MRPARAAPWPARSPPTSCSKRGSRRLSRMRRGLRQIANGSRPQREPINPDPLIREAALVAAARAAQKAAVRFELAEGVLLAVRACRLLIGARDPSDGVAAEPACLPHLKPLS